MFTKKENNMDYKHISNNTGDSQENSMCEIFLKDKAFLPDSIEITAETTLIFINHEDKDKIPYKMCCKDSLHWESKVWNIFPQQNQEIKFDIPGRYLFSCPEFSSMRVDVTNPTNFKMKSYYIIYFR